MVCKDKESISWTSPLSDRKIPTNGPGAAPQVAQARNMSISIRNVRISFLEIATTLIVTHLKNIICTVQFLSYALCFNRNKKVQRM